MEPEEKAKVMEMISFWIKERDDLFEDHERVAAEIVALKAELGKSGERINDINRTLEYLRKKIKLKKPIAKVGPVFGKTIDMLLPFIKPNAEQLRLYVHEALIETPRFLHKREIEQYIQGKYKGPVDLSNLSQQLKNLKEVGSTVVLKFNNSVKYTFHGLPKWIDDSGDTPRVKRQYIFDGEYFPQLDAETIKVIRGPD